MSHDQLELREIHPAERAGRLHKLINHLVSLSFEPEPRQQREIQSVIASLEFESKSPSERLGHLSELARLSSQHPEEIIIHKVIDDTAELLLQEIETAEPQELHKVEGLSSIWDSLTAWDIARSEPTAKLCTTLLNNFPGEGQAHLAEAYMKARDESIPFNEALDLVNAA